MPTRLSVEVEKRLPRALVKESIDPSLFQKNRLRERVRAKLKTSQRVAREATSATLHRLIKT